MAIKRLLLASVFGLGLALAMLELLGGPPGVARADPETRYVATTGADSGDCTVDPCQTVQYAVDVASDGDLIKVAYGIYTGVNNYGSQTQVVYLSETLTIRGGYSSDFLAWDPDEFPTTLDAEGQGRVFYITGDVSPTLEGLWLTNGSTSYSGGGVYSLQARPAISSCQVFSNTANYGGGVTLFDNSAGATLTGNAIYSNTAVWDGGGLSFRFSNGTALTGNAIYGNEATYGGGIHLYESDDVALVGNAIYSNTATHRGGGVYLGSGDSVALTGNTLYGNVAASDGGGAYVGEVNAATVTGNTIYGNEAGFGGGAYVLGGLAGRSRASGGRLSPVADDGRFVNSITYPTLDGNTVTANTANLGGGLYLYGEISSSWITLTNNIVADNQASLSGPGVYVKGISARMLHTTLGRNTGGDGSGVYVTSGSAVLANTILVGHGTGIYVSSDSTGTLEATLWGDGAWANTTDWDGSGTIITGTVNLWEGPRFANPTLGNYHLRGDSPAVDAGVDAGVTGDIDGNSRPYGAGPDLGADESTCLARVGVVTYPSIQQAVNTATSGQTVMVAEGVCYENVSITKTVTLEGGWTPTFSGRHTDPASVSTIDGMGAGRVISITEVSGSIAPRIDGFTITGGDATGLAGSGAYGYDIGGGIYGWYADVTVANCIITDNVAGTDDIAWGGGIGFYGGNITLQDSVVAGNVASTASNGWGGGGCFRFGTATISGNTIEGNVGGTASSGFGGGLWLANGNATLQNNTVRGNTASIAHTGYGGGMYIYGGTADLDGDVVEGNRAVVTGNSGYGGGISANINAGLTANNVEIYDNTATFGGGVHVKDSANATLTGSDIYSNTAGMGGGLYFSLSPNATLAGNHIYNNTAGYAGGAWFSSSDNAILTGNGIYNNESYGLAGGIWLTGSDDATLTGNQIYGNAADADGGGILFLMCDNATLANNIVTENRITDNGEGAGIYFEDTTVRLLHTTLAHNSGGDGSGLHVAYTSTVALTNTILVSHTVGITVTASSSATLEATLWGDGVWANGTDWGGAGHITTGTVNVRGVPAFADPAGGDYHLGPGSAAIDNGVNAGVLTDIDGDTRPIGPGFDIGADEAWRWVFLPLVLR